MFNETKSHEITVDVVILTIKNDTLRVLLVKRTNEPFKGRWAIPGGFIRLSENLDEAALRVLKEKTNVDNIYLEQLYTFGDPLRRTDARVITCAYFALIREEDVDEFGIGVAPDNGPGKALMAASSVSSSFRNDGGRTGVLGRVEAQTTHLAAVNFVGGGKQFDGVFCEKTFALIGSSV